MIIYHIFQTRRIVKNFIRVYPGDPDKAIEKLKKLLETKSKRVKDMVVRGVKRKFPDIDL